MKKLAIALLLLFGLVLRAQTTQEQVTVQNYAPTTACFYPVPLVKVTVGTDAGLYQCNPLTNTWFKYPQAAGAGTVTQFLAPAGSWPAWLVPAVTLGTTTPMLGVTAGQIPIGNLGSAGLSGTAPVAVASTGAVSLTGQVPVGQLGSAGLSGTSPIVVASTGALSCPTCNVSAANVNSFTGDSTVLSNSASTGAVTATLATQTANLLFAGPGSGGVAAPTFRALVNADFPGTLAPVFSAANLTNFPGGAFNTLTGGTNTAAAMVVGSGASLAVSGSGMIVSTGLTGTPNIAVGTVSGTTETLTGNGAASVSPLLMNGTVLTGGTGTTNFPALFIQPAGTTAATTWSTSGTGLGMNLPNTAGLFFDFHQAGGASLIKADINGNMGFGTNVTINNAAVGAISLGSTNYITFSSGVCCASKDAGLDRAAAGVVEINLGPAQGSGGRLKAAGVYPSGSFVASGQTSATTAQTLVTTTATSTYQVNAVVTCDTTVAAATVTLTIAYTDPSSTAQTVVPSAAACTTLGAASSASVTQTIRAKTGTTITAAAAISGSPNYDIAATALQITSN